MIDGDAVNIAIEVGTARVTSNRELHVEALNCKIGILSLSLEAEHLRSCIAFIKIALNVAEHVYVGETTCPTLKCAGRATGGAASRAGTHHRVHASAGNRTEVACSRSNAVSCLEGRYCCASLDTEVSGSAGWDAVSLGNEPCLKRNHICSAGADGEIACVDIGASGCTPVKLCLERSNLRHKRCNLRLHLCVG